MGSDWEEKLSGFQKHYLPNAIYMGGAIEGSLALTQNKLISGKTMIYVCENKTCQRPVEQVEEALEQMK
jgi:Highly conserved protein containing a thioredoxin domain